MSNYVQSTNFATKDNLSSGDPLKIVKGTEINTEFANIAIAVATKIDQGGALGTPSSGNGSNLTNLNATNLATGTVPDARFPATLPAVSGANLTSLNASNISSGTVGTARLASGTANSTTYLRGDQTWATVTLLPGAQGQVFTSSGTFTIPTGITALKVTAIGGGGGGGAATSNSNDSAQAGGGGGGGTAVAYLTGLTPGNTLSVTVGAGGTAGSSAGNGGAGGASSVASGTQTITTITANGGGGGIGASPGGSGAGGAGGSTSGATYGISGSQGYTIFGGASQFTTLNYKASGAGQSGSDFGPGTGSTGSSASSGSPGAVAGATGAAGIVIFEW